MPASNTLAFVAGGVVIVALSLGAGLLGGSLASRGGDAADLPPPRSVPESAVRDRLDELDRRLTNVEEQLRVLEETANAALTRAQEVETLRRALDGLRAGSAAAPPEAPEVERPAPPLGDTLPKPLTDEERAQRETEKIERFKRDLHATVEKFAPQLLKQRLSRIGDATAQGEADRRAQMFADARKLAVIYQMTPDEEDRLREILTEENESSVREIAPFLGGGLERADYGAIKERLTTIWNRRDERMTEVLDANEMERYRADETVWRRYYEKALDEMDAARRNR